MGFFSSSLSGARRQLVAHRGPRSDDRWEVRPVGRVRVGSSRLDPRAIRVVARQAPGPREHGQGPIGKFVPSHWDRLIMELGRVLRDLQGRALIPHRMVRGHDALVLHTQATGARRGKFQDRCRVLLSEGCDGLPCSQTVLLGSTHST